MNSSNEKSIDRQMLHEVPVFRREACSLATTRKIAAMLDIDSEDLMDGKPLPRGWQFPLMAADTPRSALRTDGFPGFGVPMPELDFPRLLLSERRVSFLHDIPIGAQIERASHVQTLTHKKTASGSMCVVSLRHELRHIGEASPALTETQTYLLLPARKGAYAAAASGDPSVLSAERMATALPDETLLFQYSALGFNSHKIHLDKEHARQVEGFPDLVVNGGLATLLLTEFLRREIGVSPATITVRYLVPLFCGRLITMTANQMGANWQLNAYDDQAHLAISMEVAPDES